MRVRFPPIFLKTANQTMMTGLESIGWSAFSGVAGVTRGLSGTGRNRGLRKTFREIGDETQDARLNPFQKHMRILGSDFMQMITGQRWDASAFKPPKNPTMDSYSRVGNSVTGGVKLLSDATLGTVGVGVGWLGRGAAQVGAFGITLGATGSLKTARVAARGLGSFTDAGVSAAWGNLKGAHRFMNNNLGAWGTFAAVGGIGTYGLGLGMALNEVTPPLSGAIQALPGTSKAVERFVDTGADGDLVFAMHQLR